jgi:hypothetical protein
MSRRVVECSLESGSSGAFDLDVDPILRSGTLKMCERRNLGAAEIRGAYDRPSPGQETGNARYKGVLVITGWW